jgi:hypothetical protein
MPLTVGLLEHAMKRSWLREDVEWAVHELVAAPGLSSKAFIALGEVDRIVALTTATHDLAVLGQKQTASERTANLVLAEDFISEARKLLIRIRADLLPTEARALLDRILLATDKIDSLSDEHDDDEHPLAHIAIMGRC